MKIKVIHIISSLRRGGRERQLAGILKNSDAKAIVFNKSADSYEEEYGLTEKLIYLKAKNPVGRFHQILGLIRNEKPDLIWTWGGFEATFALIISYLTGVKHINGSVRHGIVLNNRKHRCRRFLLRRSKYIVGNSRAGLAANNIQKGYVLYNGLDQRFFEKGTLKGLDKILPELTIEIKDKALLLISVANLVPFKDYFTILEALDNLKKEGYHFYYLVIGEGPERIRIEQKIEGMNLGDRIFLLGRRENVREILSCCDLFIHSSLGEGCSNAILEAMASGLPIIASDTGGTAEIVNSTFGFLFEFGHSNELASHLKTLFDQPQRIDQMKMNAREYAESQFSMERMIKEYQKIVEEVIKS